MSQPDPKPNGRMAVVDLVMLDILNRKKFGIEKYGTPVQAFNGRDCLQDAYEEVIDLAIYMRQAIEERIQLRTFNSEHLPTSSEHLQCSGDCQCLGKIVQEGGELS